MSADQDQRSPEDLIEDVVDLETFLRFARALQAECSADARDSPNAVNLTPSKRGWYNNRLDSYLEAAISWADDSSRVRPFAVNHWKFLADFLLAGKLCE